ncbi:MAG: metallophosphoesterase, partial [Nitrospinota bacterium]
MKKLKVLAISDLHLGEPEGLLNNRGVNITDVVTNKVAELAKGDGDFEDGIEELILIGDIADLSEATKEEAYTNTKTFLTSLLEKVQIDKVLYISGNHDHHLWVEMLKTYKGKNCYKECVPKTGVVIKKPELLMEKCFPTDYKGEVEAHYPFYLLNINSSYFLFDHGHLFSNLLNKWAGAVKSLEEMEDKTYEFMEILWFKGDESWWIWLNNMREKLYDWGRWISDRALHPSRGASFKEDSTPVYDDGLRDNIIKYLGTLIGLDNSKMDDFHLIFGHTHYGGR